LEPNENADSFEGQRDAYAIRLNINIKKELNLTQITNKQKA